MEAGDDHQGVIFKDQGVNLSPEAAAQSGGLAFIPILRLNEFYPGSLGKNNREHYSQS
jgi:hypothetical protein